MSIHDELRHQELKSRAVTGALIRQALESAGQRIREAQRDLDRELARIGRNVAGAQAAGISISDVAEMTGLSRQKIYELRDRHGAGMEELSYRILAQLAAGGAQSAEQLAGSLKQDPGPVQSAVGEMLAEGWLRPLVTQYEGGASSAVYKLDEAGEVAFEDFLKAGGEEEERFTVYIGMTADEEPALRATAAKVFGPEWFAVIEPGTVDGQNAPELAFHVAAASPDEAVPIASDRMRQLREIAEVQQKPVLITTILPAGEMDFLRWRDVARFRSELKADDE